MYKQAADKWVQQWGKRSVVLKKEDPEPVEIGTYRGGGGYGEVHETLFKGIPLAVKKLRSRQRNNYEKQKGEILMLESISKERHGHVVGLVGSYVYEEKRKGGFFEIGMLIWPLARCDLKTVLDNMDELSSWISRHKDMARLDEIQIKQLGSDIGALLAIIDRKSLNDVSSLQQLRQIREQCASRLQRSYGCMVAAVAWLHSRKVRHKDIKPAQFLLSSDGIWLTDFGCSKEMAPDASSTYGDENITEKYHSPERAMAISEGHDPNTIAIAKCGFREDVFTLGCTFLEMQFRVLQCWRSDCPGPWKNQRQRWSYQANISQIKTWMAPFDQINSTTQSKVARMIRWMMTHSVAERPTIQNVGHWMMSEQYFWVLHKELWSHNLFGPCCTPAMPSTLRPVVTNISESRPRSAPSSTSHKDLTPVQHIHRSLQHQKERASVVESGATGSSMPPHEGDVRIGREGPTATTSHAPNRNMKSLSIDRNIVLGQQTRFAAPGSTHTASKPANSSFDPYEVAHQLVKPHATTLQTQQPKASPAYPKRPSTPPVYNGRPTNQQRPVANSRQDQITYPKSSPGAQPVSHIKSQQPRAMSVTKVTNPTSNIFDSLYPTADRPRSSSNSLKLPVNDMTPSNVPDPNPNDTNLSRTSSDRRRRASNTSLPTSSLQTIKQLWHAKQSPFKSAAGDPGQFWCSSEGCDKRFLEVEGLLQHASNEHPFDLQPVELPYREAKLKVDRYSDHIGLELPCGVPGCGKRYYGCFKEQELASHMKARHRWPRLASKQSFSSSDGSDY
jgi:serine/threonine protein kinase